ncbi:hypothetical protein [Arthrobacter sp. ZGTC412]|uniref:hypothetical protein n=1 Tax=Arthrobacter sp. ZGTC412 TaxID=2058900 RepID=UPI000CE37BC1|nr:hypothetical protein [Arthrobacter sp. ZGTC412]
MAISHFTQLAEATIKDSDRGCPASLGYLFGVHVGPCMLHGMGAEQGVCFCAAMWRAGPVVHGGRFRVVSVWPARCIASSYPAAR